MTEATIWNSISESSTMPSDTAVTSISSELTGRQVTILAEVVSGGNNAIYRVSDGSSVFAFKFYRSSAGEKRDRLNSEHGLNSDEGADSLWQRQ